MFATEPEDTGGRCQRSYSSALSDKKFLSNCVNVIVIIVICHWINCFWFVIGLCHKEGNCSQQGFMQDKIIASHTRFGEHMDVNC